MIFVHLSILKNTQEAIDGMSHKLVQPGETRWLSYEGSVPVVLTHYATICLTLEEIYVSAGNMSCDAGGLAFDIQKVEHPVISALIESTSATIG
jgi:hypothetical protein